jgi:hypothetical protein
MTLKRFSSYLILPFLTLVLLLTACPAPLGDGDDDNAAPLEESESTDDGEAEGDD